MQQKDKLNTNMKDAAIENIIVWMVLFAMFVSVFFFVLNYSSIIRAKDNIDAIADYGANYVATNGIGDDLSDTINDMLPAAFQNVSADTRIICNITTDNTFQVIFNVTTSNDSYYFYTGKTNSKRVVFNQVNSNKVTCDLEVTLNK